MLIQETWTNKTEGYQCGRSDLYEPFTDNIKRLFRSLMKEYGRCVSKVYVDNPDGFAKAIGWVFEKRMKYDDCNEYFIQHTWVTLHKDKPTKTIQYHYLELEG
jgi:hypothetical protein